MPTIEKGDRYGSFWRLANTATQPKPYVAPLPYSLREGRVTLGRVEDSQTVDIRNDVPNANGFDHLYSINRASNDALNKVYDVMGQAEDLLVAWKERQSALDLAAGNIRRLVGVARAIKRRDPRIVRAVMRRKPRGADVPKTPAALWLEYHFAIVPTISDIHHALGIFSHEFPVQPFTGSGRYKASTLDKRDTYNGDWRLETTYDTVVKCGGEIYGINPDISLASRLGFGQPLSVAWEMTPFSWFVDYFVNVGELVKNLEPRFPGIKVRHDYTTVLQRSHTTRVNWIYFDRSQVPPSHPWYNKRVYFTNWQADGVYMQRSLGLPSYTPTFKSPLELKGQQCSYIAAVLTGLLSTKFDKFSK